MASGRPCDNQQRVVYACSIAKQASKSCFCRYEDDLDEGEYFLYTGSGGRDLSGNKRTSKVCTAPPPPRSDSFSLLDR